MWIDVEQNTDEWFMLRAMKPTSSKLGLIMAHYGKAFGDPAKKYAVDIAIEQITGVPIPGSYSNDHMARGHEDEPLAVAEYEAQLFTEVTNGGFYDLGDFGCSPDGRVGDDGLIEIKSAIPSVHFERIRKSSCDSSTYMWQMIGNLKASEREYIDFVSYCSSFPEGKRAYIIRYNKSLFQKEYEMIDSRLEQFMDLVYSCKKSILNSNYFITGESK